MRIFFYLLSFLVASDESQENAAIQNLHFYSLDEYKQEIANISNNHLLVVLHTSEEVTTESHKTIFFANATGILAKNNPGVFTFGIVITPNTKNDFVSLHLKGIPQEYEVNIDYDKRLHETTYSIIKGSLHIFRLYRRKMKENKNAEIASLKKRMRSLRKQIIAFGVDKPESEQFRKELQKLEEEYLLTVKDSKKEIKKLKLSYKMDGFLSKVQKRMDVKRLEKQIKEKLTEEELEAIKEKKNQKESKEVKRIIKRLKASKKILGVVSKAGSIAGGLMDKFKGGIGKLKNFFEDLKEAAKEQQNTDNDEEDDFEDDEEDFEDENEENQENDESNVNDKKEKDENEL
ncbi:hypothetical protein GPJ56_004058 [Histomonas meleagridis]|uniref:uncharacterized protein n=1 Tax=Histomonas meleagridis TaxID=135588 RepID=UPI003559ECD3|nr:hypothetical protein GPJ56_004058 [Histomonas meleagridis]KAH0800588.1 hypothetical protein GO595_006341 [Histomonas meleagridis]